MKEFFTLFHVISLSDPSLDQATKFSIIVMLLSNWTFLHSKNIKTEFFGCIFAELFQFKGRKLWDTLYIYALYYIVNIRNNCIFMF